MKRYFLIKNVFLCILLLLGLVNCGGDGDDGSISRSDFVGVWDARLNFSFDGCGLAAEGIQGIVDEQVIESFFGSGSNEILGFTSRSDLLSDEEGEFQSENKVVFIEQVSGDIYGIGIPCALQASISYEINEPEVAALIFSQAIICDDGFSCRTDAAGSAKRKI